MHILISNALHPQNIKVLYFEEGTRTFSFSYTLAFSLAFDFVLQLNGDLKGIGVECAKNEIFAMSCMERLGQDVQKIIDQLNAKYSNVAQAIQKIDRLLFTRKAGELERCIVSNGSISFTLTFTEAGFQISYCEVRDLGEWKMHEIISFGLLDQFVAWCSECVSGCIRKRHLCEICCCEVVQVEELFQCPNVKCAQAFHVKCISRWFKATSMSRYNVVQGECLNCGHPLSINQ